MIAFYFFRKEPYQALDSFQIHGKLFLLVYFQLKGEIRNLFLDIRSNGAGDGTPLLIRLKQLEATEVSLFYFPYIDKVSP